jgi:hypothetical protein
MPVEFTEIYISSAAAAGLAPDQLACTHPRKRGVEAVATGLLRE